MTDLITLDEYKEYKGITSTPRDGKFQTLITQVSALIENYCNRKFFDYASSPGITEWFDAKTELAELKHFPLIQVNSVNTSVDGGLTQVTLTEDDSTAAGYFVDLENGQVRTQVTGNKFLTSYNTPYRSLEVNYFAGYTILPEDLKLAIIDLVSYYEEGENKPSKSMLSATMDNPLPYMANSFPPHIRRVLDLYRDLRV